MYDWKNKYSALALAQLLHRWLHEAEQVFLLFHHRKKRSVLVLFEF